MASYVVFSWGVVILAGAIAVYVYNPGWVRQILPAPMQQQRAISAKPANRRQKSKKSKIEDKVQSSDKDASDTRTEDLKTSKKRKIVGPIDKVVLATAVDGQKRELPRDTNNDLNDEDFAQQLAKAQAGTNLQSKTQHKSIAPTRRDGNLPSSSSTDEPNTGVASSDATPDAHDGKSSIGSLQQTRASGKDVSDMLEPALAAPTTLRLTNIADDTKKQKQAPKFEQVLTKKQRAAQAKREEQKRINLESDKLHEQKKQDQLRRARMAEGTSNQTRADSFAVSTQNAWQNRNTADTNGQTPSTTNVLLDTFESGASTKSSVQTQPLSNLTNQPVSNNATALKNAVGQDAANALAASRRENGNWTDQLSVSEEEQMQKVREKEEEDAWEPVHNKKSKKKGRSQGDTSSEATGSRPASRTRIPEVQVKGTQSNGVHRSKESTNSTANRFDSIQVTNSGLQEDDWTA